MPGCPGPMICPSRRVSIARPDPKGARTAADIDRDTCQHRALALDASRPRHALCLDTTCRSSSRASVKNGKIINSDRIVAGQPAWPTPSFSAEMKTIVFHPSWGVPDGIKRKELGAPIAQERQRVDRLVHGRAIEPSRPRCARPIAAYTTMVAPSTPTRWTGATSISGALTSSASRRDRRHVLGTIKFIVSQPARCLHARHARARPLRPKVVPRPEPRAACGSKLSTDAGSTEILLAAGQRLGARPAGARHVRRDKPRKSKLSTHIPVHVTYSHRDGRLRGQPAHLRRSLWPRRPHRSSALRQKVRFETPRYDDEVAAVPAEQSPGRRPNARARPPRVSPMPSRTSSRPDDRASPHVAQSNR